MSARPPLPNKLPQPPFRLTVTASAGRTYARRLATMLRKARALAGGRVRELSVAIVGDRQMAALHEQFMGVAGPTDVLTFELDHDPAGRVLAGEIVINAQEARRSASRHGASPADELLLYAVHGLLHLSGYDDTTKMAYTKMHRKEDQILTRLGVGPVFAPQPAETGRRGGRR